MTNKLKEEEFSCPEDLPDLDGSKDQNSEIESKNKPGKEISQKETPNENEFNEENESIGFEGFGFSEELLKTIKGKGYKTPSPIQQAAIPELMLGRDLVGQAQTGTGKTAAFALPLLERIDEDSRLPQVLVLAPTRELAMQVADSFKAYSAGSPHLKILALYGGSDFRSQINALKRGVEIVVGTPGRVMDHMRQGTLATNGLKALVLDEADEMLRMGFIDDVEWVLDQLPKGHQMILFSATMPNEIRRLSKRYLKEPAEITIRSREKEARLIRQRYIIALNSYKLEVLKRVLETVREEGVIIFVRTKAITLTVAENLEACGHDVAVLNGDVPQNQRERTVERLRRGSLNILVATDVAARGLDVERIGLVINYDVPFDSEAYVHRIGRTGRAGRNGEAILFVSPRERHFLRTLERAVAQPIEEMEIPNNNLINRSRIQRLETQLEFAAKNDRKNDVESKVLKDIIEKLTKDLELDANDIALAAISFAIGESPFLENGDETWIKQATSQHRRHNRREERGNTRRRSDKEFRSPENNMERFRVEVGHRDRVKPGNLVGAIANETGLQGRMIGRIQIFDNYSFIDLPKGMPEVIFKDLRRLKVMNRELQINRV